MAEYAESVDLQCLLQIANKCKVSLSGLNQYKRFLKPTTAKYATVIKSLKANLRPISTVAAEFGLNAKPFRLYLHAHKPELAARLGKK